MNDIHPTAIIEPGSKIGSGVTIEPYVIVKKNVTIGDNVIIRSHAYIDGNSSIGDETVIYPFASIGTKTQAKKFRGETTYINIGKRCEIRECVTINSSYEEGSIVSVGNDCIIMAYCHIAHHCKIGDNVIMANGAMLAGHVEIEDFAIIGGMTPVHQFVRIGRHAMVGGFSRITNDIPPYTLGAGIPYRMGGLNLVGLKRHNFRLDVRKALTKAFNITYRSGYHLEEAINHIEKEVENSKVINHWVDFCKKSKRGLIGLQPTTNTGLDELHEYKDLLEE